MLKNALIYVFFLVFLISCGGEESKTEECDKASSSSFEQSYECPSGNPKNDDIVVVSSLDVNSFEAGYSERRLIEIKNNGDAKLFDFKIISDFNIVFNNCPNKFNAGSNCAIEVEIKDNLAGSKERNISFSDRTGNINKSISLKYEVLPSYPIDKKINYDINELNFDKQKIIVGPLQDRFGNIIEENFIINSNKLLRSNEFDIITQENLRKESIAGSFSFTVETDSLDDNILLDSGNVTVTSPRVYKDGTILNEFISLTFFNNKPTIDGDVQNFNILEDSSFNPLSNLIQGEDPQGQPVTHIITKFPDNGVISNCLTGDTFINFITCTYTPKPNFFGEDSFEYKSYNGQNLSFNSAKVKINISNVKDKPILTNIVNLEAEENTVKSFTLEKAIDYDNQTTFQYQIVSPTSNGQLSCNLNNCTYSPNSGFIGNDSFTYKAIDIDSLESNISTYNINIKNKNDKPLLGGNETYSTIEDQEVSFILSTATDPDNDSLIYKVKTQPNKGSLINCLVNNNLSCTYKPNKNIDTADTFSYVAIDPSGEESDPRSVTITITQVNDPPAFANLYQEQQVVPETAINFSLDEATDPDSISLTYDIVDFPDKGILNNCLNIGSSGLNCQYQAPSGVFNDITSFTYKAQDPNGLFSEVRTVRILLTSSNSDPNLTGTIIVNMIEEEEKEFQLIRATDDYTPQNQIKYFIGSNLPQNGQLKNCLNDVSSKEDKVNCIYIPNENFVGQDDFTYYAQDGSGNNSSEILVTLNVSNLNDAPSFANEEDLNIDAQEDIEISFSLESAIDPEEDNIIYSLNTDVENGILSCNFVSLNCTYKINLNFNGIDSFSYKASDGEFSSNKNVKISVAAVNDAPILEDQLINSLVLEDNLSSFLVNPAIDVDNSDVSYEVVTLPTKGILSNCLNIDGNEGLNCYYLPKSNENTSDSFTIKAYDGELYSEIKTITINLTNENDVPYFSNDKLGVFRIEEGDSLTLELLGALDLEGDFLTYEIVDYPTKGQLFNCLEDQSLDCTYLANKNVEGEDFFTYKASDPFSDSFNLVKVSFLIEKEKSHRIFSLKTKSIFNFAQKNLLSTPSQIYSFPNGKMFYLASSENNYSQNTLKYISNNGSVTNYNINGFKGKELFIEERNELLLFDIGNSSNKIISVEENLLINEVSFPNNLNPNNHVYFNKNVYAGSNQSKLYKLNLLTLNNNKYYYYDHLINKERLNINNDNSKVTVENVLEDKIIFSYIKDNKIRFASIQENDSLEIFPETENVEISQILESNVYIRNNNQKIYYLAQLSDNSKRIIVLDLKTKESRSIDVNLSLQNNLSKMSLFYGENKDYIVFFNEVNSRIAVLQLDFSILTDISYENIKKYIVSKDKRKLLFIDKQGRLYYSKRNPSLYVSEYNGLLVQDAISVKDDQFLLKRFNSRDMFFFDSRDILEKVQLEDSFAYEENNVIYTNNQIFLKSKRSTSFGEVFDFYEYKYDLKYDVNKNISNYIYGLPEPEENQNINLVYLTNNGTLSSCLSLNSSSINDLECNYLPNNNYVGIDSFRYDFLDQNNDIVKQLNIELNIKNQAPYFKSKREVDEFASFIDLNMEVLDYTYINDELFFSAYDLNKEVYSLYRYNNAEDLRLIFDNESKINNLESNNDFLFFNINNELYKYLPTQKTYSVIYREENNVAFQIQNILAKENNLYIIAKGSGNPPINSLIIFNLNNNLTERVVLPSGLENGSFIKFQESFYIESVDKIAFYDQVNKVFIRNDSLSDPIQVGRGVEKDGNLVFIVDSNVSSIDVTSLVIYDPNTQTEISKTPIFVLGFKTGDIAIPRLNENGSYSFLVETIALDNSGSTNELIRKDIQSRDERILDFSGIYGFDTLIREDEEDLFFVSRSDNWENVVFYKYNLTKNYFVLNGSSTNLDLPIAEDKDEEVLTYEITAYPQYGRLENCMGLNGSSLSKINCDYIHTDTNLNSVIDSFSYRAYDGFEYSEIKEININIRNNPPEVQGSEQSISVNKNIDIEILLLEASDPEGNQIYYIVEDLPLKGSLSGCSTSISNLNTSKSCLYSPNNNETGFDTFTYRAYDGLSFSEKVTVNINIIDNNSPIFSTSSQKNYISKNTINYIIILEKALDPQGRNLTYSITRPTQFGSISNCFNIVDNRMQCTYTPNNPSLRALDSFKYQATNGEFTSDEREVLISITASNMTGSLGDLTLSSENDLKLIRNGVDNTDALRNLEGFNYDTDSKTVTLPANREYNFRTLEVENGYTIEFKSFDNVGNTTSDHGFTKIYAQGSCIFDGNIQAIGGLTNGTILDIIENSIDNEELSYTLDDYIIGVFGGKGGGSSEVERTPGLYGNPSLFKSGNGQEGVGDVGDEIEGGDRGRDGLGIYIKCLESIEGIGTISVKGEDGENGLNGRDGLRNDVTEVSFGGSGGSGGGNGGFGGAIYLKSTSIFFSGDLNIEGGIGGSGGEGGFPDLTYQIPFRAGNGTDGQDGINGFSGICKQSNLNNSFENCF